MTTQCLASTGSNLLAVLGIGFVLAIVGFLFLRTAKGRAAVMVLVLVGGGLLFSQATSKPASAACVASSATTTPTTTSAASGTTTTSTTSTTSTTTTTAPAAEFTFIVNFDSVNTSGEWSYAGCTNFTASINMTGGSDQGTALVNVNSSFPSTQFQSVPVPVTPGTSYTVTYGFQCQGSTANYIYLYGSLVSNVDQQFGETSHTFTGSGPYAWSSTKAFSVPSDGPASLELDYGVV